jgi:hypothetical protein
VLRGQPGHGAGGYPAGASAGRDKKSDLGDCEWIQRLHSCGLLRGSFRPEEAMCMPPTLVRDKANLVAERLAMSGSKKSGSDERARGANPMAKAIAR